MRNAKFAVATSFGVIFIMTCAVPVQAAGTFSVSNTNDSGAGSLRQAILDANAAGGGTINVNSGGLLILASPLPIIAAPLAINGNGLLVSGNNQHRVFFIDAVGAISFNNLNILNGKAKGGDGVASSGGGLGAGGGVFLSRGDLTLSNVTFAGNAAVGGMPGTTGVRGGGGGLGGNGADTWGGGGGYRGSGAYGDYLQGAGGGGGGFDFTGGSGGNVQGGPGGGQGGTGPAFGGGAGTAATGGGGGGGGGSLSSPGASAINHNGGDGGRFGGGGAGSQSNGIGGNGGDYGGGGGGGARGGNGGFGGGGGAGANVGGNGGFGAGGGGATAPVAYGIAGAFAANGVSGASPAGGAGAALGAHVFVRAGASLTVVDTTTDLGTLSITGGSGAQAAGSAFFLAGPTTFSVSANQTRTIGGSIADIGNYLNTSSASGFAPATLIKSGPGTLALDYPNTYTGGTVISQGTLTSNILAAGSSLKGTLTFNDANTASADTTFVAGGLNFFNPMLNGNFGSGKSTLVSPSTATPYGPVIFNGAITLEKSLTILAQDANLLNAMDDAGQTRFDGIISGTGGLTITGGHMVQFRAAAAPIGMKIYIGRTTITGNSTLSLYDNASTPNSSTVQIDAGSTLILEGLPNAVLGGLAGAGTVTNNPNWNPTSTLEFGRNNDDTAFTGQITGGVILTKAGTGTLDFGPQDNTTATLTVAGGRVRLTGDQHLQNLYVNSSDAGVQALDLNGRTMRFNGFTFNIVALEDRLNHQIGTSADGVYDSTAAAKPGTRIGITYTPGAGQTLTMKLTLAGDANLDGKVDFKDLVTLAQNYNSPASSLFWDSGDFTYDQKVNFNDLVLLAQNYGSTFPPEPVPGATAQFNEDLAAAFATAPEPAVAPLLVGATLLMRRRESRV